VLLVINLNVRSYLYYSFSQLLKHYNQAFELNIVELSQKKKKCVCSGGKLRKSSQVLHHLDQGKYFKINQKYFAHICPEYGFRVKMIHFSGFFNLKSQKHLFKIKIFWNNINAFTVTFD